MLKDNWRGHLALGGIAAVAFALFIAAPLILLERPQNRFHKLNENAERYSDQDAANDSLRWLRAINKLGQPEVTANNSKDSKQTPEQYTTALDLRAQWITAVAAREMVTLTMIQILIGAVGLLGLWLTVRYAKQASLAAEDAARHAAAQGNIIRKEFLANNRPKLHIVVGRVNPHLNGPISVIAIIGNVGLAAITYIKVEFAIHIGESPPVALQRYEGVLDKKSLKGGEATRARYTSGINDSMTTGHSIFCIGTVAYTDEINAIRYAGFCRRYNRTTGRFEPTNDPDYEYAY